MAAAAPDSAAATRVLAVDDDPLVCQLIGEILGEGAYELHCARSDREALARLDGDGYRALIVDINLGAGVTGFDLARHARRIDPAIAVVYVSGHSASRSFETFRVRGGVLVEKPFTAETLKGALDAALADRR
jgi:DNA-binding NtrC family response regulator